MKKNFVYLSALTIFTLITQKVNALNLSDKVYFKANIYTGATLQVYTGDIEYIINQMKDYDNWQTQKMNYGVVAGFGGNIYYKVNNTTHFFIGIDAQGRYPFSHSDVFYEKYYSYATKSYKEVRFNIKELLVLSGKIGTKTVFNKNFALEKYVLLGANMISYSYGEYGVKYRQRFGLVAGVGVNVVINDRYIVGLDYRYGSTKVIEEEILYLHDRIQTHNVTAKIGIYF